MSYEINNTLHSIYAMSDVDLKIILSSVNLVHLLFHAANSFHLWEDGCRVSGEILSVGCQVFLLGVGIKR